MAGQSAARVSPILMECRMRWISPCFSSLVRGRGEEVMRGGWVPGEPLTCGPMVYDVSSPCWGCWRENRLTTEILDGPNIDFVEGV